MAISKSVLILEKRNFLVYKNEHQSMSNEDVIICRSFSPSPNTTMAMADGFRRQIDRT